MTFVDGNWLKFAFFTFKAKLCHVEGKMGCACRLRASANTASIEIY